MKLLFIDHETFQSYDF